MPEDGRGAGDVRLGRRRALTGVAGVVLALPVLSACGGDDGGGGGDGGGAGDVPSGDRTDGGDTDSGGGADGGSGDGGGSADVLAPVSEVPVGGGVVNRDAKVVVTQPVEGEFRAFTAVCTHQGCTVSGVDGTINCPCHGSRFAIDDGSVVGGPAPAPLAEVTVRVRGGDVVRG